MKSGRRQEFTVTGPSLENDPLFQRLQAARIENQLLHEQIREWRPLVRRELDLMHDLIALMKPIGDPRPPA